MIGEHASGGQPIVLPAHLSRWSRWSAHSARALACAVLLYTLTIRAAFAAPATHDMPVCVPVAP